MKSREFVVSLTKNPPKTMAEMLLKVQKYMNAEDTLTAIKTKKSPMKREGRKTIGEDEKQSVQIVRIVMGIKG